MPNEVSNIARFDGSEDAITRVQRAVQANEAVIPGLLAAEDQPRRGDYYARIDWVTPTAIRVRYVTPYGLLEDSFALISRQHELRVAIGHVCEFLDYAGCYAVDCGVLVGDGGRNEFDDQPPDPPEGVREVIGRRLADLSEATNVALGAASVLGREFDITLLATITQSTVAETLNSLEPAEDAQLIAEVAGRPGRFSFSHALVRSTLIEELGTNRRVRLHRAAGLALEAPGSAPLGELAHHFAEAAIMGETDRAVRYAREAAEQALAGAALDDALVYIRRGIDIADLGDVDDAALARLQLVHGRALDALSDTAGMLGAQQRAYELAVRADD